MRQIGNRLADLERRLQSKGRGKVYRVHGGAAGDDCSAFLGGLGIVLAPSDVIVHRPFYHPGDAGPVGVPEPMGLLG